MNNTLVQNARKQSLPDDAVMGIGWMYAQACWLADNGIDIRTLEVPRLIEAAQYDFNTPTVETQEEQPDPVAMKTQIISRIQVEGTHSWPGCPIEEVEYLKHPHRHIFHIEVRKSVSHADRDIEIIQLGHTIREYLNQCFWSDERNLLMFGSRSCEMIASQLVTEFSLDSCQVMEDNENGAIVTAEAELV